VLLTTLLLYVLALITLVLTGNPNLFPTVVLLGSFMVPAAYVAFFYERRHLSRLTMPTTVRAFVYGGLLGVISAAILEPIVIRHPTNLTLITALETGAVEELAKILGLVVIARHLRHNGEVDGIILGAAVGMGFAALESFGYAFTAFFASQGSLSETVFVILLRGILSPLGHGTWTAILAGVLFRESSPGHFHVNRRVFGAFVTVAILHGLWDATPSLVAQFTSSGLVVLMAQSLVGLAGLLILWSHWREGLRLQAAQAGQSPPPGVAGPEA
jgi:RsiW-degrading membrane proteinase PrsW (M82 family)